MTLPLSEQLHRIHSPHAIASADRKYPIIPLPDDRPMTGRGLILTLVLAACAAAFVVGVVGL